jgi:hypothetical protein
MTDVRALELLRQGQHWLDIPKKTLIEAQELRLQLLEKRAQAATLTKRGMKRPKPHRKA